MRIPEQRREPLGTPQLISRASILADIWKHALPKEIESLMKISAKKAAEVSEVYQKWLADPGLQVPAIDVFVGDIYSGLQVQTWSDEDRQYAHKHLLILSGLYGALRACDGALPYRLEMAYKLPYGQNLYKFWDDAIASLLPADTEYIMNLSAVEYTKAVLPYTDLPVITPKFLTISPKTSEPTFVTVHAKIARGAFARWLIRSRIHSPAEISAFSDLGYRYYEPLSTPVEPVFVCKDFGGIGLSVRLTK